MLNIKETSAIIQICRMNFREWNRYIALANKETKPEWNFRNEIGLLRDQFRAMKIYHLIEDYSKEDMSVTINGKVHYVESKHGRPRK